MIKLSATIVEKLTKTKSKSSWINQVDRELVNNCAEALQYFYKEKNLNMDVVPVTHLSLVVREQLGLSTKSPYNQLKPFVEKLKELGFNLVPFGKTKAIKLEKPKSKT